LIAFLIVESESGRPGLPGFPGRSGVAGVCEALFVECGCEYGFAPRGEARWDELLG
jgi:hypothetical protein